MKQEPLFPTNITPEEEAAGFKLVETCIPLLDYKTPSGTPTTTVAAVLPLVPEMNVRLIKMRNPMPELGQGDIDYQLEIFGIRRSLNESLEIAPKWHQPWDGSSLGLGHTIARYKRDGIPDEWQLHQAPDERIVSPDEID